MLRAKSLPHKYLTNSATEGHRGPGLKTCSQKMPLPVNPFLRLAFFKQLTWKTLNPENIKSKSLRMASASFFSSSGDKYIRGYLMSIVERGVWRAHVLLWWFTDLYNVLPTFYFYLVYHSTVYYWVHDSAINQSRFFDPVTSKDLQSRMEKIDMFETTTQTFPDVAYWYTWHLPACLLSVSNSWW